MPFPIVFEAIANKNDLPLFMTPEYLERCANDSELQRSWVPRVGDFYFCKDLWKISQITDLDRYYSEGDPRLKLPIDHGKDGEGRWQCDIFIPEP
jgi:hypothetical protein